MRPNTWDIAGGDGDRYGVNLGGVDHHDLNSHDQMTDSLLRNSRAEKTFHARKTTINYWRSFTALIGIHEVIPSSSHLKSHRLIILHIFKTFFSHLALTLPNDKGIVGMAKPLTISDHVTRVLYLHTLIDYQRLTESGRQKPVSV